MARHLSEREEAPQPDSKRAKLNAVVDLTAESSDDEPPYSQAPVDDDLALARRLQQQFDTDAAGGGSGGSGGGGGGGGSASASRAAVDGDALLASLLQEEENGRVQAEAYAQNGGGSRRPPPQQQRWNAAHLDLSRVEVLRRDSPVVLFRGVGSALRDEATRLCAFDSKGSGRRCGAAVNSGTNGKNCTDTYRVLGDTSASTGPGGATQLNADALARYQRRIVDPVMAAAARAVGAPPFDYGPHFEPESTRTAELRVLKYAAPKRTAKSPDEKLFFHRHLDHGHYAHVCLASLGGSADFWLKLGRHDAGPSKTKGSIY